MDTDRQEQLDEAYKRGLMPPDMKQAYEEARSRGLIGSSITQQKKTFAQRFHEAGETIKQATMVSPEQQEKTRKELKEGGVTGMLADVPMEMGKQIGSAAGDVVSSAKSLGTKQGWMPGMFGFPQGVEQTGLNTLNLLWSPVSGAATSLVGRPIEAATGVKREIPGTILSAIIPAGGEAKAVGAANKIARTVEELKAASSAAYKIVDSSGMKIHPQAVQDLYAGIVKDLSKKGFHPKLMPKTQVALDEIQNHAAQAVGGSSLQDIDVLRRIVGHAAGSIEKADRMMARVVQDHIDDFIDKLDPSKHLVAGTHDPKAISALKEARDLWAKKSKGEILESAISKAKTRSSQFSQSGMENALRVEFRKLANNERAMRRFSKDEQAAIKKVAEGGTVENLLRMGGKFAPHGIVSSALSGGMGFLAGGPAGAVGLPLLGEFARQGATGLTMRNALRASELARGGDPAGVNLLKAFAANAPKTRNYLLGVKERTSPFRRAPLLTLGNLANQPNQ